MTRGKHANATEHRRSVAEEAVAPYQRRLVALTEEIRVLKEQAKQRDAAHQAVVRQLRAERDEGVTPALAVAHREVDRMRTERNVARQHFAEIQKHWGNALTKLVDHARDVHGMKKADSFEWAVALIGKPITLKTDNVDKSVTDVEEVKALERARGERV